MRWLSLALVSLLGACVSPQGSYMPDGPAMKDPPQWIDYCRRNPKDPAC